MRSRLANHGRETLVVRHAARLALRNELKDDVTALLLSCGMALEDAALNEAAVVRVKVIEGVANQIKSKLALSEGEENTVAAGSERAFSRGAVSLSLDVTHLCSIEDHVPVRINVLQKREWGVVDRPQCCQRVVGIKDLIFLRAIDCLKIYVYRHGLVKIAQRNQPTALMLNALSPLNLQPSPPPVPAT
jgi:hypothetical protein